MFCSIILLILKPDNLCNKRSTDCIVLFHFFGYPHPVPNIYVLTAPLNVVCQGISLDFYCQYICLGSNDGLSARNGRDMFQENVGEAQRKKDLPSWSYKHLPSSDTSW